MRQLAGKRPKKMGLTRFCKLLRLNRTSLYYHKKGESDLNIEIMKKMDKQYLEHPTSGVLTMRNILHNDNILVNNKRIRRLMHKMNLIAIYPMKCLSRPGAKFFKKPYLLRGLEINHSNQVWSTDISYIPMEHGFMYLYAVIDVYSRYIVGWSLNNTLHASNCLNLIKNCIKDHGKPEIINSDQGVQYTSGMWSNYIENQKIKVSMDSRGRCKDNIWIERFWRTIKQEYIYLNPADNGRQLYDGIKDFIKYYNYTRPHQGINNLNPAVQYQIAA